MAVFPFFNVLEKSEGISMLTATFPRSIKLLDFSWGLGIRNDLKIV